MRIRHLLWVGLVVAAALSLSSTSQASAARCATGALRAVALGGLGGGAAGHFIAALRLELRGPGRCTLSGTPGVTLLNGRRRLKIHVIPLRYYGRPPQTVQLYAHHPAYFSFSYPLAPPAVLKCPGSRITGLSIIPPNDRRALSVRLRLGDHAISLCPGSVTVSAVSSERH